MVPEPLADHPGMQTMPEESICTVASRTLDFASIRFSRKVVAPGFSRVPETSPIHYPPTILLRPRSVSALSEILKDGNSRCANLIAVLAAFTRASSNAPFCA